MKQNKYDDPKFFEQYSEMPRSKGGLEAAGEWPVLREMLPELEGKAVLDLGCGYGWHCRYAREMGARSVLGIDISAKMLEEARRQTDDSAITYEQAAIEDIDMPDGQFDVVLSSLALHYVQDFARVCEQVYRMLVVQGTFVISVEHPIFTARAEQDWHYDANGERLHWPVDHYQEEGLRETHFLGSDVQKYHRTVATYMNTLITAGFTIKEVAEPQPTEEALERYPEMKDEPRRPIFLLMAVEKRD